MSENKAVELSFCEHRDEYESEDEINNEYIVLNLEMVFKTVYFS